MEYVDGETLTRAIGARRLSENQIAEVGRAIADALAEAHARGIIHRDIKPDNIVLAGTRVVVLDFGIAKRYGTDAPVPPGEIVTEAGVVLGTVSYMSPEQATGKKLDGRSDIFSLGVMLYEALAGLLPFRGKTNIETLTMIIRGEPADLREVVPTVSPELAAIVARCLRKNPDERFGDAAELARALARVAARVPAAPPPSDGKAAAHVPADTGALTEPRRNDIASRAVAPPATRGSNPASAPPRPSLSPEPPDMARAMTSEKPPSARTSAASNLQWVIAGASFVLVLAVAGGFLAARHLGSTAADRSATMAPVTETARTSALSNSLDATTPEAPKPAPPAVPKRRKRTPAPPPPESSLAEVAPAASSVAPVEPPPPPPAAPQLPATAEDSYRIAMDRLEASGWHYLDASGAMTADARKAAALLRHALRLDPRNAPVKLHLAMTRLFGGEFDAASKTLHPLVSLRTGLEPHERAMAELGWSASTAAATGEGAEDFREDLEEALEEHGDNREFAAFAVDARTLLNSRAE